jgi:hypothetical protein
MRDPRPDFLRDSKKKKKEKKNQASNTFGKKVKVMKIRVNRFSFLSQGTYKIRISKEFRDVFLHKPVN